MPKWKLVIEYEGTRYRGWQEQKNARTIQGELRQAAEAALGQEVELGGAGRTDAGVHALGQVAHLKALKLLPAATLRQELNDRLPADINVRSAVEVTNRFHARHHATERYYLYQIATRRTAFAKPYVWWIKDRLDPVAMQQACTQLTGRRDFASFSEPTKPPTSTIVEVIHCDLTIQQNLILFRIGASHFLWKMVRRIVGVLVEVGRGRLAPADVGRLLSEPAPAVAQWTAPPSGLFLEYVRYEGGPPPGPLVPAVFFR